MVKNKFLLKIHKATNDEHLILLPLYMVKRNQHSGCIILLKYRHEIFQFTEKTVLFAWKHPYMTITMVQKMENSDYCISGKLTFSSLCVLIRAI